VTVHLLPGVALENIPLALVIIVSFVLGLLFGLSFSLVQMLKRSLRKSKQNELKQDKSNISTP
jgi:putative membrane protein